MSSPYDQASGVCNRCGRSHFHTHDSVTTAASTSHKHTGTCQNATEVKRQLLTDLMEQLPKKIGSGAKTGHDHVLNQVTSVIQNLLGGEK